VCSWQNVQKQKTSLELGTLWTKGKIIIETDKKKHGGQTRRQMVFHCILASTQNLQTMCENIWIYICKKDTKSSGIAGICGLFVCVRGERCPGKERWDTIAAVLNIEWGEWWWNFNTCLSPSLPLAFFDAPRQTNDFNPAAGPPDMMVVELWATGLCFYVCLL